jgi:hypothetical protein
MRMPREPRNIGFQPLRLAESQATETDIANVRETRLLLTLAHSNRTRAANCCRNQGGLTPAHCIADPLM